MKLPWLQPPLRFLTLALTLAIGALGIGLWDAFTPDRAILDHVSGQIQEDFLQRIYRQQQLLADSTPLSQAHQPGVHDVTLKLTQKGELLGWNSQQYVPGQAIIRRQLENRRNQLLIEKNLVFYNIKRFADTVTYFRLIPLKVSYPIRNEYLSDYVYLGRYQNEAEVAKHISARQFTLLPTANGVNIKDEVGRPLFSIRLMGTEDFRLPLKRAVAGLAFISFIFLWLHVQPVLRRRVPRIVQREMIVLGSLIGIRFLLFALNLPNAYLHTELFSPSVFALNEFNPSLGDLTLNTLLLLMVAFRIYVRLPKQQIATWLTRFGQLGWVACCSLQLSLAALLMNSFVSAFELLATNSKTYYEFADLFRLNIYSFLLSLNIALVLLVIFILLYAFSGIIKALSEALGVRWYWYWLFSVCGGLVCWAITGEWPYLPAIGIMIPALTLLEPTRRATLRFALAPSLVVLACLACITNLAVSRSLDHVQEANLRQYANHYVNSRDLITEYVFNEVAENIAADKSLWLSDTAISNSDTIGLDLLARIVNNHLVSNFKGYDFQIFIFDASGKRLDNQADLLPYSKLTTARKKEGETLSKGILYYVPTNSKNQPYLYIAQFPVYSASHGKVYLQIELHPKATSASKLYPLLLIDQSVRQKLTLPPEVDAALYQDRLLQRREGQNPFPIRYAGVVPQEGEIDHVGDHLQLVQPLGKGRLVILQAPLRSIFDQITAFSFLFYFYVLLYGAYLQGSSIPGLQLHTIRNLTSSLSFRIQLFTGLISSLPLILLWLLTSPLFEKLYYDGALQGLRQNMQQVSDYIENEPSYMADINTVEYARPGSVDLINRISNLLGTDINVYNLKGKLFNTTRPKIYQASLTSPYINPEAFDQLRLGATSETVLVEQIGKLSYRSGYIPLFDGNSRMRGYLNLPFLSQQGLLENQVRKFAALLVNLYMVLMLGIIVGGLFITKTLTGPLRLLKAKLDDTDLGGRNERLHWASNDELGAIISSYNLMLGKLEQSEKKLARNEKEFAWREMARQVAHEIKNPLTPMKLSIQHLLRTLKQDDNGMVKPEHSPMVEKISRTLLTQIESLSQIASSFSQFAAMPALKLAPIDLGELLGEIASLYQESPEARLMLRVPEKLPLILGDHEQLTRVFVNLVRNAQQAIETEALQEEEEQQLMRQGVINIRVYEDNDHVTVEVADNGCGIPPSIQARIFEPNFSTKTSGMGMGLAITRRTVENMEGSIRFVSTVRVGTTFILSFPIAEDGVAEPHAYS